MFIKTSFNKYAWRIYIIKNSYWIALFALIGFLLSITQILGVSRDYLNYDDFFNVVRTNGLNVLFESRFEPGFTILTIILTAGVSVNVVVYSLFVVIAMILKGWLIKVCSSSQKIFLVVAAFYLVRYFPLHELTQLRLALGIALILVGTIFLWEGEIYTGTAICVSALLFHMSVVAIIPALFLNLVKRWQVISIALVVFILTSILSGFLTSYLSGFIQAIKIYQDNNFENLNPNPLAIYLLIDWAMIVVSLLMWKKNSLLMKRVVLLEILGMAIFYGAIDFGVIAIRIRESYSVFWVLFVADSLRRSSTIEVTYIFVSACIIFYFYLYMIYTKLPFFVNL